MRFNVWLLRLTTHSSCFARTPSAPRTALWPGTSWRLPRAKQRRGATNCWVRLELLCGLRFDRASSRSPWVLNTLLCSLTRIRRMLHFHKSSSLNYAPMSAMYVQRFIIIVWTKILLCTYIITLNTSMLVKLSLFNTLNCRLPQSL